MKAQYRHLLQEILDAVMEIHDLVVGMDFSDYFAEEEAQTGVFRNLESIGRGVRGLPKDVRERCRDIAWDRLAPLPQTLVSEADGINHEAVWECVSRDILPLEAQLNKLLESSPQKKA
jgi:uncharacterized protein with HEPN domain